jgi:integrase
MPPTKFRSAKEDVLNDVEAGMLLSACVDLLDNLVVRIPLYAGLRIGEVQHLKKTWLVWDKGIIQIPAR